MKLFKKLADFFNVDPNEIGNSSSFLGDIRHLIVRTTRAHNKTWRNTAEPSSKELEALTGETIEFAFECLFNVTGKYQDNEIIDALLHEMDEKNLEFEQKMNDSNGFISSLLHEIKSELLQHKKQLTH